MKTTQLIIKKLGAIDIGSNAVRCLISYVYINGKERELKKISLVRIPIRLGEDVFSNGNISLQKQNQLIYAMKAFDFLFKAHQVENYRACATSAMREANNGSEIINLIKQETDIDIKIITGTEEAQLIFKSGISNKLPKNKTYLYVDIGGGSTELTLFSNHEIIAAKSFKIGTVRILQNKVSKDDWMELENWTKKTLENVSLEFLVGSGGNVNKLVKLISSEKDNKKIDKDELVAYHDLLCNHSYQERITKLGLNSDRADVILPAANILIQLLKWSKTNSIFAPKFGLSDGMIRELSYE